MNTLQKFGEGVGAMTLGTMVGYISENLTARLSVNRNMDQTTATLWDYALDGAVDITFLILGITLVEKAMPAVSTDLHSLLLFSLGVMFMQRRLPQDVTSILQKLTTPVANTAAAVAPPVM